MTKGKGIVIQKNTLLRELAIAREKCGVIIDESCVTSFIDKIAKHLLQMVYGRKGNFSRVKVLIRKIIVKFSINACFTTPLSIFSNLTLLERL